LKIGLVLIALLTLGVGVWTVKKNTFLAFDSPPALEKPTDGQEVDPNNGNDGVSGQSDPGIVYVSSGPEGQDIYYDGSHYWGRSWQTPYKTIGFAMQKLSGTTFGLDVQIWVKAGAYQPIFFDNIDGGGPAYNGSQTSPSFCSTIGSGSSDGRYVGVYGGFAGDETSLASRHGGESYINANNQTEAVLIAIKKFPTYNEQTMSGGGGGCSYVRTLTFNKMSFRNGTETNRCTACGSYTNNDQYLNGKINGGGLIRVYGLNLTLEDSLVEHGVASLNNDSDGGCINNARISFDNQSGKTVGGLLVIKNTTVRQCQAKRNGGAVRILSGGLPFKYGSTHFSLVDSSVISNASTLNGDGGGIYADSGAGTTGAYTRGVKINKTSISDNVTANNGGGAFVNLIGPDTEITTNTFIGNQATGTGGGIFLSPGSFLYLMHNLLVNNQAQKGGGMSTSFLSYSLLIGNVIVHNSATNGPSALLHRNTDSDSNCRQGNYRVINSIIAYNKGPQAAIGLAYPCRPDYKYLPYSFQNTDFYSNQNGNFTTSFEENLFTKQVRNFLQQPKFVDPGNLTDANAYKLTSSSGLIDCGLSGGELVTYDGATDFAYPYPTTDFAGNPRYVNSTNISYTAPDPGLFEYQGTGIRYNCNSVDLDKSGIVDIIELNRVLTKWNTDGN